MDKDIIRLLTNSGLNNVTVSGDVISFEDPACIIRSFDIVLDYAWIVIATLTGILLFGWGISLIRGAKNDFFSNAKALILIFGILTAIKPIMNLVYGKNLFTHCTTMKVSKANVEELLNLRNKKFDKSDEYQLYENFDIQDSGPIYTEDTEDLGNTN